MVVENEIDDGLAYGRQAWLRRKSVDSFRPACARRLYSRKAWALMAKPDLLISLCRAGLFAGDATACAGIAIQLRSRAPTRALSFTCYLSHGTSARVGTRI
jgi:hypothetical protein